MKRRILRAALCVLAAVSAVVTIPLTVSAGGRYNSDQPGRYIDVGDCPPQQFCPPATTTQPCPPQQFCPPTTTTTTTTTQPETTTTSTAATTSTSTSTSTTTSTSSTLPASVNDAATSTMITSSLNPSVVGESVTFTAIVEVVNGPNAGDPATDGTVTFTDDSTGTTLATVGLSASGMASVTTSALAVGTHEIVASYSGAPGLDPSDGSFTLVVIGVADAGGPYAIDEGEELALDATGSNVGSGATYTWDVNGDTVFGDAVGATPTLAWTELEALDFDGSPGEVITVTVDVTEGGSTFRAITSVTVDNVAPTATFANDGPVPEGSTATVTFSAQSDPSADDRAALTYSYDFNDDGDFDDPFEVAASPLDSVSVPAMYLANGPSTATVRAELADDDGGITEYSTDIGITNAAATARIDGPATAVVGVPVTIKVGAVDPSPGDMGGTFAFTVDWGDGTPIVRLTGPADPPVTHTYTAPGAFTVTATATDPDGDTSEPLTFTITVTQAPTTTSPPTTPSTEPTTPTTTPAPTTAAGGAAAPATTAPGGAATTTVPAGSLPSTGGSTSGLVATGLALVVGGLAVVAASCRRRPSAVGRRA